MRLSEIDFDYWLAYRTTRQVSIKDVRLGLINLVGVVSVVLYIVIYVVFYSQGFRLSVSVSGTASIEVDRDNLVAFDEEFLDHFCMSNVSAATEFLNSFWQDNAGGWTSDGSTAGASTSQQTSSGSKQAGKNPSGSKQAGKNPSGSKSPRQSASANGANRSKRTAPPPSRGLEPTSVKWDLLEEVEEDLFKLPCYFAPADMMTMSIPPGGVFLTTRRNITTVGWVNLGCAIYDGGCSPEGILRSSMYVPSTTHQKFEMLHTVQSGDWLSKQGDEMTGIIEYADGSSKTVSDGMDPFTLGDLLHFAGEPAESDPESGHYQPTLRQRRDGGIMLITIRYQNGHNCHSWWWCFPGEDDVVYTVNFKVLTREYELAQRPQPAAIPVLYTTWIQRFQLDLDSGWLIQVRQEYDVGVFNLGYFILNLCASLGLMSVIKMSIDLVATKVLADRKLYSKLMILESTDKDEWHKGEEEAEAEASAAPPPTLIDAFQAVDDTVESCLPGACAQEEAKRVSVKLV